ncbi:MAG: amidohydrolase family protein [Acidimicrobiia bacterium]
MATFAEDELPKIISVDDHVVEPPHVWQTWLPEKYRAAGPRVERKKWGDFRLKTGAKYEMVEDPDGMWGDAWYYEDRLIYVHKRFVAIPLEAFPDGNVMNFDRTKMVMTAITYDEMRPGCYIPEERVKDLEIAWVDGSLPFPTFPRFCGQTFMEGNDKELGLACVEAYNNWMIEEWCGPAGSGVNIPLGIIPLWDLALATKEVQRIADKGVRAICFSEIPPKLGLPSIHSGDWDPLFSVCNDNGVTLCMHIGSSSSTPVASPDAPGGVGNTLAFNNSFASLADWLYSGKLVQFPKLKLAYSEGQIGWIPYALERADTVWEVHDSWIHSKEQIPDPPSTYYYGRVFGCFTADHHGLKNLDEVGEDNVCFETDYPHTDTTWPHSKEYAMKMVSEPYISNEQAYKILRGNAIRMLELDRT